MNQSTDNTKMEKVTFMCPSSVVQRARKFAFADDRDLSSVCRMALAELLGINKVVTRRRGRPSTNKKPVKCI